MLSFCLSDVPCPLFSQGDALHGRHPGIKTAGLPLLSAASVWLSWAACIPATRIVDMHGYVVDFPSVLFSPFSTRRAGGARATSMTVEQATQPPPATSAHMRQSQKEGVSCPLRAALSPRQGRRRTQRRLLCTLGGCRFPRRLSFSSPEAWSSIGTCVMAPAPWDTQPTRVFFPPRRDPPAPGRQQPSPCLRHPLWAPAAGLRCMIAP